MAAKVPDLIYGSSNPRGDGRDGCIIRASYHPAFVARIKLVPNGERAYDPETHDWWVSAAYAIVAQDILVGIYKALRVLNHPEDGTYTVDQFGTVHQQQELF